MSTMKAIHIVDPTAGAIGLELTDIPIPSLSTPYDILVKVMGGSLNPGELQYRAMSPKGTILGFDGAGLVVEAGPEAMFSKGDAVLYCGDCQRQGSNAQHHVVDSRLAGRKPEALGWSDAASLPLVGITAWEMFEDRFRLKPGDNQKEILLVVNGAGGVGSVAIQLAKTVGLFMHEPSMFEAYDPRRCLASSESLLPRLARKLSPS
jgi:NADPH2:quinone reductase